jgi:hypothetical protein
MVVANCPRCQHSIFNYSMKQFMGINIIIVYCAECGCAIGTANG